MSRKVIIISDQGTITVTDLSDKTPSVLPNCFIYPDPLLDGYFTKKINRFLASVPPAKLLSRRWTKTFSAGRNRYVTVTVI